VDEWEVRVTNIWRAWFDSLDAASRLLVIDAIDRLAAAGPMLGRPLVDRIKGSTIHNMKELRPGSAGRSELRVLFVFDPWRSAILLTAGDKAGNWNTWYREAIPEAERLYHEYLIERRKEKEEEA
jgi:hypothetical protein